MLLALIGFITIFFLYMGYIQHKFVLKTLVKNEQKVAAKIYTNTFRYITDHYESIANNILINEQILDAFESRDRETLLKLTAPIYEKLTEENPYLQIMHFHTKETRSFLRLHKPQKYGDDLSSIRHMINNTNRLKSKQTGMEVGRYGINYRVALPVINREGKHLGAFEFGIHINYIFNFFNKDYGFTTVLLLHKKIFDIIYENNKKLNYQPFSEKYYIILPNSSQILEELKPSIISKEYALLSANGRTDLVFPITDLSSVADENIGKILFIQNLNYYTDQIALIRNTTIGLSLLLVLLSFYLLQKIFNNFALTLHSFQNRMEIKNRTLSKLANTDHLTKLHNRKYTDTIIRKELNRAKRYEQPLSLIMLDIDDFKIINDTYGHNSGDRLLKDLSKLVLSTIRDSDYFGRWGGEEFILIAPQTSLESSVLLAEKIRMAVSEFNFKEAKNVTCSLGVVQYSDEENADDLIHNADLALYEAKNSGKNKVIIYGI